jgi:hypothetical protein
MASVLPGGVCVLQRNVCILRLAKLDADCSPSGGADSGIVTTGIVSMTATPNVEEGVVAEPKNGCGRILATVTDPDIVKYYDVDGEIATHDVEMMTILFGGSSTILGKSGGPHANQAIGWASPGPDTNRGNGVYLEVITQVFAIGAGDCVPVSSSYPPYVGHIFGKVYAVPGERTFENDVANVAFTGKAYQNPALFDGPWNDFPGAGYIPTRPYVTAGYSQTQFDAINAVAGCGLKTLPAGS